MVRANGQRDGVGKTRDWASAFEHSRPMLDSTRVSPYGPAAREMPQSMRPDTRQHLTACTGLSEEMGFPETGANGFGRVQMPSLRSARLPPAWASRKAGPRSTGASTGLRRAACCRGAPIRRRQAPAHRSCRHPRPGALGGGSIWVGLVVIGCTRDPASRRSPTRPDRCGSRVADDTAVLPEWEKCSRERPPRRRDGGTPVGPENRRFSAGRSRHLARCNRQPFAEAECLDSELPGRRSPTRRPDTKGVILAVIRQPGCNHTLARQNWTVAGASRPA